MSTVGIIGAMEVEVETLKKHMKVRRTVKPIWNFVRAFSAEKRLLW